MNPLSRTTTRSECPNRLKSNFLSIDHGKQGNQIDLQPRGVVESSFYPSIPVLGWFDRWFGWSTKSGRAKRALVRAGCVSEPSESLLRRLEGSAAILQRLQGGKSYKIQSLLGEILVFLSWSRLNFGDLEGAIRWLTAVDALSPPIKARLALRCILVDRLWCEGKGDACWSESGKFLADSGTNRAEHGAILERICAHVYKEGPRQRCIKLLQSAHSGLADEDPIAPTLALARCPWNFNDINVVAHWTSAFRLEQVAFCARMLADAHLHLAHVAEFHGDDESMEAHAKEALSCCPDCSHSVTVLVRSRLYRPDGTVLAGIDGNMLATLQKSGLYSLAVLHDEPSLKSAKAVLRGLQEAKPDTFPTERRLGIRLLQGALTSDWARSRSNLKRCVELSDSVAETVGPQNWTEINKALAEIKLDRRFSDAVHRLGTNQLRGVPEAEELQQLARFLAGWPQNEKIHLEDDTLRVVARAFEESFGGDPHLQDPEFRMKLESWEFGKLADNFPSLAIAIRLLKCRLQDNPREALFSCKIPEDAPAWGEWWRLFQSLVCATADEVRSGVDRIPVENLATRRLLSDWWSLYAGMVEKTPKAIQKTYMETASTCLGNNESEFESTMIALGSVCKDRMLESVNFVEEVAKARSCLAIGNCSKAHSHLGKAITILQSACPLARRMWHPALQYWRGVAAAHGRNDMATELLKNCIPGPLEARARAQLTLLALQMGDWKAVSRWESELNSKEPAAVYASAVAHTHRQDFPRAERILNEFDACFGDVSTPYHPLARRLRAALAERQDSPMAEAQHRALLEADPSDSVVAARLARIRLRAGYASGALMESCDATEIEELLSRARNAGRVQVNWLDPYECLLQCICPQNENLTELSQATVTGRTPELVSPAWKQLLARKYLKAGQPAKALQMYPSKPDAHDPDWFRNSTIILQIWGALVREVENPAPCFRKALDKSPGTEAFASGNGGRHPLLASWCQLAAIATSVQENSFQRLAEESWPIAHNWAFGEIAGLWSVDPVKRRVSGCTLRTALEKNRFDSWSDSQKNLLPALVAYALADDDAFLGAYPAIEPELDQLPVPGPELWLAVAEIHFRQANWAFLLETDLPDCVADLSDARVRLMIGLAYAQAAEKSAKQGDHRTAHQRVRQARENLRSLTDSPSVLSI